MLEITPHPTTLIASQRALLRFCPLFDGLMDADSISDYFRLSTCLVSGTSTGCRLFTNMSKGLPLERLLSEYAVLIHDFIINLEVLIIPIKRDP